MVICKYTDAFLYENTNTFFEKISDLQSSPLIIKFLILSLLFRNIFIFLFIRRWKVIWQCTVSQQKRKMRTEIYKRYFYWFQIVWPWCNFLVLKTWLIASSGEILLTSWLSWLSAWFLLMFLAVCLCDSSWWPEGFNDIAALLTNKHPALLGTSWFSIKWPTANYSL